MVLAPVGLSELYQQELEWQQRQILLDNSAILLGRQLKNALNRFSKREEGLRSLHRRYHSALICSAVPATALACRAILKQLKIGIFLKAREAEAFLRTDWISSRTDTVQNLKKDFAELTTDMKEIPRPHRQLCSICQLPSHWKWEPQSLSMNLWDASDQRRSVSVSILKEDLFKEWNYQLWAKKRQAN